MLASVSVRELKVDAEFQNLIPPASADELNELRASVARLGFTSPLTAWRDSAGEYVLLDGHQRFQLWRDGLTHGHEPAVIVLDIASRDEAKAHILTLQLARRNLSAIDRIALVRTREPLLRALARENQSVGSRFASLAKQVAKGLMISSKANESVTPHDVTPINCRHELATAANVSEQTFANATTILDAVAEGTAEPAVIEDIRSGKATIHGVAKTLKAKPKSKSKSGWQSVVNKFIATCRRLVRHDATRRAEIAAELRKLADEFESIERAAA